jgi:hypothetical protein
MKTLILAFCAFTLSHAVSAQTTQASQPAATQKKADDIVKFSENKYNFGKIKQGVPVTHDFAFVNSGSQPVVIESATASCGCTTPTWPKTPVTKDQKDKISAGFNAAAAGPFEKTITVKVAGYSMPLDLHISGEVLSADDYAKYEAAKPKKSGR